MTATLINMLATPAATELAGLSATQGLQTGPNIAKHPGDPQSFVTAMQSLSSPHGDADSGSLLPSDLAVTGTGATVPATIPGLTLPVLSNAPMTGETVTALLDEGLSLDGSAGRPLPETGPEIGNILPSVTGHTGSQPSLMSDTAASTMTASAVMLQQAKPDPMQAALTSVTARSMVPDSQLNPDARTSGPALVNTEESSLLTPQMNAVPEPELELVLKNQGQVQRDFESLTMYSESVATGKSAENIAMRIADSGSMGLAQSTPHVPPQFSQLMELPQFQNMRPLQPMADPQTFMEGLGQRLMIMSEKGVQSARLKLYPENLGTLDIKIQVEDNIARVWFTAEHGQAREALETALPKLKDLFAQQDMELIRADVGSDQDRQRASDAFSRADDVFSKTADGEPDYRDEPSERPIIMTASEHALDIYV